VFLQVFPSTTTSTVVLFLKLIATEFLHWNEHQQQQKVQTGIENVVGEESKQK